MRVICTTSFLVFSLVFSVAATLMVPSASYPDLEAAAAAAAPGDTVLILNGTYTDRQDLSNIAGASGNLIYILAQTSGQVIWQGGSEAWHLSDCSYLHIEGLVFQGQTANGVNIDDAGTFATPTHHITIEDCLFQNLAGTGNNDLLKLSGLDNFAIRNCTFLNGSPGGSGIDMVGCHMGVIEDNLLDAAGVSGIQAKGGTQFVRIEGNMLKNMSQRALNLGGSTGLSFFRPPTANFEAADLQVYSNIFIGSWAPIAYVGCVRVEVINNTIYLPDNWIIRILQENTNPGFLTCADNTFSNNLVVRNNSLSTDVNIGPNTAPATFTFSNNLWYHTQNPSWTGPTLPVAETGAVIQQDPQLVNPGAEDFNLSAGSAAAGQGLTVLDPALDYDNDPFNDPRSIGAQRSNAALPVSLLSFTARMTLEGSVHLRWQTGYEEGVEALVVEHSLNQVDWQVKARVAPANRDQGASYDAWDEQPSGGVNFYRLAIVDLDGTLDHSSVVPVEVAADGPWSAYSVGRSIYLLDIPIHTSQLDVELWDLAGRKVAESRMESRTQMTWDLPESITPGPYLLHLRADGRWAGSKKVVLAH